jgi:DNA-binding MarR family transcriptional regulator
MSDVFFDKSKLLIVTMLSVDRDGLSFSELLEKTELTNGNLSSHIQKLEEQKIVKVTKTFLGKRPLTTVELTAQGRQKLKEHIQHLKSILDRVGKLT